MAQATRCTHLSTATPHTDVPERLIRRWRAVFRVYTAPDRESAEIRARHLRGVLKLTPAMMLANIANGVLLVTALWGVAPAAEQLGWLGLLVVYCGANLQTWRRWQQRQHTLVSPRTIWHAAAGAAVLAGLWGFAAVSWFGPSDPNQRVLLSTLVVGMMCGGAFALATMPHAALAYIGVLGAASVAAIGQGDRLPHLQALLVIYTLVLGWNALLIAQAFTSRLVSQREAARQGQLVGLLLRDFEEHSADLLWEVGADGRLTHAAPRLVQALGMAPDALERYTLRQALAECQPADGSGQAPLQALQDALSVGRAFRDLAVPVHSGDGLRWWSFTAKPLPDDDGHASGWRGVASDVTAARESHRQLAFLAHFDPLTGLANRVQLRAHLSQALARALARPSRRAALVCLDVDHFKTINDTLGHAAGDAVLVAVAERLRSCLRQDDLAARLGGDEFALVIANANEPAELHALARRLVATLCQPVNVGGRMVAIGVSLGVALAPDHGHSEDELMAHADLALYAAKEGGRGRHAVFVHRMGDRRRRRVAIEQGLREALAHGELHLHWQPRVDIARWQTVAAEALLRWQHPVLGAVSPSEFVPVAEASGLIAEIGTWVLMQACHEAVQLPPALMASVNVSAAQLTREDFFEAVTAALAASGLPPHRLELEVTESLQIDAESVALRHLHALRAAGIRIALDDFGTGYSSLAYLRRFPFDTLKIDRGFVHELTGRSDARAIVKTIVDLARTLGMQTLAEGVEQPAELDILRAAGCDAIQGYLVARPMPLTALRQLLANGPAGLPARELLAPPATLAAPTAAAPLAAAPTAGALEQAA